MKNAHFTQNYISRIDIATFVGLFTHLQSHIHTFKTTHKYHDISPVSSTPLHMGKENVDYDWIAVCRLCTKLQRDTKKRKKWTFRFLAVENTQQKWCIAYIHVFLLFPAITSNVLHVFFKLWVKRCMIVVQFS